MAQVKAKPKPVESAPTGYESDFYLWCFEQAELLRRRCSAELDLPNMIEELQSMGREQRYNLKASYRLLISHLLKWQYQPERRSASWEITIIRERSHVKDRESDSHALRSQAAEIVEAAYPAARREAQVETGLPKSAFPPECPYTLDQLRDPDWLPDAAPQEGSQRAAGKPGLAEPSARAAVVIASAGGEAMAGTSQGKREGAAALDSVKTKEKVEATSAGRAAAAKAEKASKPARNGSGDSPKRQGDKLEKARDAAAGRPKGK
jgi:hypothetical protein